MTDTQHSISVITVRITATAKNTAVRINNMQYCMHCNIVRMATAILVWASMSRLVANAFQLEITLYLSVKSTPTCAVLHRVGTPY